MNRVVTREIKIEAYDGLVNGSLLEEINKLSEGLKGLRVVHVNADSRGSGVEILRSLTPLLCDAGIDARWYMLTPDESFRCVCQRLQRYIQGNGAALNSSDIKLYLAQNEKAVNTLSSMGVTADIWVFHDFQVLPMLSYLGPYNGIWACHDGVVGLNDAFRDLLFPHMMNSRTVVASLPDHFPNGHSPCEVAVIPPAIDPLQPGHDAMSYTKAREILSGLGVDPDRPVMGQVSRNDGWGNSLAVIDAFRLARKEVPGLQLVLAGAPADRNCQDGRDPSGGVVEYIEGDPDIHIFTDCQVFGEREINAVQHGSDVILQPPGGDGFDLRVAEAMWKERPVIGSNCSGTRLQIRDGLTGFLAGDVRAYAIRAITLLKDKTLADLIGNAAHESVRRRYLVPRLLRDYLHLFSGLVKRRKRKFTALRTSSHV